MEHRIETKGAFRIVGVSVPPDKGIEKNFAVIPQKWREISMDGTLQELIGMMDTLGVLGVSTCDNEKAWRYYIAAATSRDQDGLEEYIIPAATWAIFSGAGTGRSIQELERRIVTEWLPTSGYEYGNAPDLVILPLPCWPFTAERAGRDGAVFRLSTLPKNFNYKLNDKPQKLCYDTINRQPKPNFRKGDADMKAMTSANFYYECEQAIFQSEEYSCSEVRPYQDKQQLAGSST